MSKRFQLKLTEQYGAENAKFDVAAIEKYLDENIDDQLNELFDTVQMDLMNEFDFVDELDDEDLALIDQLIIKRLRASLYTMADGKVR